MVSYASFLFLEPLRRLSCDGTSSAPIALYNTAVGRCCTYYYTTSILKLPLSLNDQGWIFKLDNQFQIRRYLIPSRSRPLLSLIE